MENNIKIKVKGMFCTGCEDRIKRALTGLNGVSKVSASFKKEEVDVTYNNELTTQKEIEDKIEDLDYEVLKGDAKNKTSSVYILIILLAIYVILSHLGLLNIFNIFPTVETTMSYSMLFVVGLLTSIHCIAMCGGINLSQSIASSKNGAKIIKSNFNYNLGRVISYTVIGAIVGAIGSVITLNGVFKGAVAIIAGIIMIIMSINMLGIFPSLKKFNIRIPKKISTKLNSTKKGKSSFYIGLLNGLMPCGPLQSMQIYALSTGSIVGGALSMFLFSIGTVPLMFGFGVVSSKLNKKFAKKMLTISSIIIFLLGLGMLGNGLALSGVRINIQNTNYGNMAQIVGDYQEVTTEVDYGNYEEITVRKDIPLKWTIIVPEGKLNGCNNEIIIIHTN